MMPHLLYKNNNFDDNVDLPFNIDDLISDLNLDILFNTMTLDDEFLLDVLKKVFFTILNDKEAIIYRQDILKDCIKNSSIVRELYDISLEAINNKKKYYFGFFTRYPAAILDSSIDVLEMFMDMLKKIKGISTTHSSKFESEGFKNFFKMIDKELCDEYFEKVKHILKDLRLKEGTLISSKISKGFKGIDYTLIKDDMNHKSFIKFFLKKNLLQVLL